MLVISHEDKCGFRGMPSSWNTDLNGYFSPYSILGKACRIEDKLDLPMNSSIQLSTNTIKLRQT
jgi:hypothetical protein